VRIRVDAMVDLLCLTAVHPEVRWRSHRVFRKGERAQCETSTVPGEDADERRARALEGLTTLLDLRRRGLRAPIPMFPGASGKILERLRAGKAAPSSVELIAAGFQGWKPFHMPGDQGDDAVRYCFDASYEELASEPATAADPTARLHHGGSRLLAFSLALADGLCVLDHVLVPE